ncbi:MAG: phosphoadenosine phosphosulfate reductase family protein, partial [Flammeovirgaceae bacterium]|nr:phosphoadenosine phosphosulfate reductase family protein [Flammeovirgaceae bacterium]MDW8288041.1 phosphoadenosine phosphosulfate reductase family protein [Flammeovirgaceae bacterium]
NVRVFPISNWTELDVWNYIRREKIALPSLYYAHRRDCVWRNGQWLAATKFIQIDENEKIVNKMVRFRTIGDATCTACVESEATDIDAVINEIIASRSSERGSRMDDQMSEAAMEDRKKNGYF